MGDPGFGVAQNLALHPLPSPVGRADAMAESAHGQQSLERADGQHLVPHLPDEEREADREDHVHDRVLDREPGGPGPAPQGDDAKPEQRP